jgi:hypothetical protein
MSQPLSSGCESAFSGNGRVCQLSGGALEDILNGDAGDNQLHPGAGGGTVSGGADTDTASFNVGPVTAPLHDAQPEAACQAGALRPARQATSRLLLAHSQPGTTKISHAIGGAMSTMLMPHCMSRLNT